MSAISEVDIRDWEKIDIKQVKEALDNMDDYAQMNIGIKSIGAMGVLTRFIETVEVLRNKQLQEAAKNIPALFKPFEKCINYE